MDEDVGEGGGEGVGVSVTVGGGGVEEGTAKGEGAGEVGAGDDVLLPAVATVMAFTCAAGKALEGRRCEWGLGSGSGLGLGTLPVARGWRRG
jgi:hypothetical protein